MQKPLCLLMLLAVCAPAQTVEGRILNAVTGGGISGVNIEIYWSGDLNRAAYLTSTDAEGHFRIDSVQEGTYQARYEPPGEWGVLNGGFPKQFQVTTRESPVKLEARLIPIGRLSGRVIDGRGQVVPEAVLEIGTMTIRRLATDAQGRFDLRVPLLPGGLALSVVPPPSIKPPDPEPGEEPKSARALAWVRTWYPGVAVPEAASKIVLPPGGELASIELKLLALPAHAVRGLLLDPEGKPVPQAEISLVGFPLSLHVESKPDGTFEFPAVVDGKFYLTAEVESGVRLRAKQWLEMAGHAQEGVKLRLNAPFTVPGKAVMEARDGLPAPKPPSSIFLVPAARDLKPGENPMAHRVNAYPSEDGYFSLEYVYSGSYRIVTASSPPGYYLDEVRVGEAQPATPEVELSSDAAPIMLVYKTNGGTVRGTVENCGVGRVVLVPQDPAMRWPDLVRDARCSSNDHYEINAVRPGEYYVLALSGNGSSPGLAPNRPDWVPDDVLLNQASKITVRPGEASSADLHAIAPPAY